MFLRAGGSAACTRRHFIHLISIAVLLLVPVNTSHAQGGSDNTGTGGRQTIQGRIFFPSGRRVDTTIKVLLESMTSSNLSVFVDSYGAFSFNNLVGGSYTIAIDGNEYYEPVREAVVLDGGGARYLRSTPNKVNVQIFLQPKRHNKDAPGLVNASLAAVPKEAMDLYSKGLESIKAGDSHKAIEQLNGAILIYRQFPLALNELGMQYLNLKETDKAIAAFREAIQYSPEDYAPRLNLGIALWGKNQLRECEAELREALKRNQDSWVAHMYIGLTKIRVNNHDEAEKEFLLALSLGGSELSLPHYYLGGIYWGRKDYKRAADELEQYVKLSPKAPNAEQTKQAIKELRSKTQ